MKGFIKKIERINKRLSQLEEHFVSVSVGVAFSDKGFSKELYDKADKALYVSKTAGRNRITFASKEIIKSGVKTAIKKVEAAVESGDKAAATEALTAATSAIDKACTKGVYHKNTVARKISNLQKAVNTLSFMT